jgi:hypothetical protein
MHTCRGSCMCAFVCKLWACGKRCYRAGNGDRCCTAALVGVIAKIS